MPRRWLADLHVPGGPGLAAFVGGVLLMAAPLLPGLCRLIVLPALLLAPGYALLRLLRQAGGLRSISIAVPVSLAIVICAALILDASGIRLSALSLGPLIGGITILSVVGSYGRQLFAGPVRQEGGSPSGNGKVARPDAARGERS
jgi:hypothetical protein